MSNGHLASYLIHLYTFKDICFLLNPKSFTKIKILFKNVEKTRNYFFENDKYFEENERFLVEKLQVD